MRAGDDFLGLAKLPSAIAVHVLHPLAEELEVRGIRRIDDVDEGERDGMFRGEGADPFAVAEQDGGDDLFFDQPGGSLDDTNVLTFGENDPFRVPSKLIEKMVDDAVARLRFCVEIGHGGTGACTAGRV